MVSNPSTSSTPLVLIRGEHQHGFLLGILVVCVLAFTGCSGEDRVVAEIREAYEAGHVLETIALCKRALREGTDHGEIHLYYGLSLFRTNRDYQAFDEFESAVNMDSSLAGKATAILLEGGGRDIAENRSDRAAARLKEAVKLDPTLALGKLAYLVGDSYFHEKAYAQSIFFYEQALAAFPDTSAAEVAYLHMAEASIELGNEIDTESYLRALADRDPGGASGSEAKWRLASLLSERAANACRLGNYEEAVSAIEEVFRLTDNETLIQNSRFVLGEAYEGLGRYSMALEQYRFIADSTDGVSASLIEKAKEKIEDFKRAGLSK